MVVVVALTACVISAATAVGLVATQNFHGRLTFDCQRGVQKLHARPTLRIGGLALLAGAIAGVIMLQGEAATVWRLICLTALPAFAAGLAEDLTKRAGVRLRLCATLLSGLLFCLLGGQWLQHADVPGVDLLLALPLIGLIFTSFAMAGLANAINLIDGVNGLAAGAVLLMLAGFALLAAGSDDAPLLAVCLVAMGAMAGFLLLNYPLGLMFLGDAGAYGAGFVLATVAVLLPLRNPEISPLTSLLTVSYPVIETLTSIHRRLLRSSSPGQADRLHLHSLVYRSFARRAARAIGRPGLRNPMTGTLLWLLPLISTLLAVTLPQHPSLLALAFVAMTLLYLSAWRRVALLRRQNRNRVLQPA